MSSLLNIQPSESLQMGKMLVSKSSGEKRRRSKKKRKSFRNTRTRLGQLHFLFLLSSTLRFERV